SDIEELFNKSENKSVYDYIDIENNNLFNTDLIEKENLLRGADGELMTQNQIKDYMQNLYLRLSADISYNISQYDGMIDSSQKTEAQRHPIMSFAFMFKGWLSIASSRNFNSEFYNFQTGNWEQGIMRTVVDSINKVLKDSI